MAEQMLQVQPRIAFQLEFATFCHILPELVTAGGWLAPRQTVKSGSRIEVSQVRPESHGSSKGHSCSNWPPPGFGGSSCVPDEGRTKALAHFKPFASFRSFTIFTLSRFISVPNIFTKNAETRPVQSWLGF